MNHYESHGISKFGYCQIKMSKFVNLFSERMEYLLGNRKKHPWGKSLGLSHGLVARLFDGELPASEKLIPICKAENVSLTWLIEGSGETYMVHHSFTDEETAETLSNYIDDEKWEVLVLKNHIYPAIILTLPTTMLVGKKHIDYTAIEIIAGPINTETLHILKSTHCSVSEISPDDFTMRRLYAGKMSNQEIFGDDGKLASHDLMPFNPNLSHENKVAETAPTYGVDLELMKTAISETETICIEETIKLSVEQKSRVIAALYKHMQRTHSKVITKNILLMTLDTI